MELHKFHIRDFSTRSKGYGNPITGCDIRVTGIQINFSRPTSAQNGKTRFEHDNLLIL
ncbi:hypothetical protein DPPLL_34610 [Desulfofustis limnaeus]|uniref:Uncharacterized protein n=1 Tax=Desulfofustis limnaeus TaxID=2740163 RepID=A0ABM7WDP0_9BACT|nr:hypothetical protein DPPLL_34610 [Desulfofustis limnaeus]